MKPSSPIPLVNKACVECSRSKTRCVKQESGPCRRCTRRQSPCWYKTRGPMGRPKHDDVDPEIGLTRVGMHDMHPHQNNSKIEKSGRPRQRRQEHTEIINMYLPNRASHDDFKGDVPRPASLLPLSQGNSDSPLPDDNGMELRMAPEQDWLSQVPRSSLNSECTMTP